MENQTAKSGFFVRIWRRLPVIVRALLAGLVVSLAGSFPWGGLAYTNLQLSPRVPWSVPLMAVYLWFYWQYLQGRWWPRSTAETRQKNLRARALPPRLWRWALLAGGLFMAASSTLIPVVGRFASIQVEFPDLLLPYPFLTVLSLLVMSSVVAGIVEEASFRGYMQSPIEKRHGPAMAILVVTVVFGLAHLTGLDMGMSAGRMFFILLAGLNYGILVHLTGSILPGLVLHASGDVLGLSILWWLKVNVGPRSWSRATLAEILHDRLFWLYSAETVVLAVATVWAFRKLAAEARREEAARTAGGS